MHTIVPISQIPLDGYISGGVSLGIKAKGRNYNPGMLGSKGFLIKGAKKKNKSKGSFQQTVFMPLTSILKNVHLFPPLGLGSGEGGKMWFYCEHVSRGLHPINSVPT
jgi:hypothetical protein